MPMPTKTAKKSAVPKPIVALPDTGDCLMTRDQVCAVFSISRRTFHSMVSGGRFPQATTRSVGDPRWQMSVVREWMRGACGKEEG